MHLYTKIRVCFDLPKKSSVFFKNSIDDVFYDIKTLSPKCLQISKILVRDY